MQKLLFYFMALFVLFFACTQEQAATDAQKGQIASTKNASDKEEIPVATPIPPPQVPANPNLKAVPQAPQEDLVYPKDYVELGVLQFKGAKMDNNLKLDNSQGKYGRRIKMTSNASYDEVFDFYKKSLEKNGWTQNEKMNKTMQDEDIKFFSTNYVKENHTLMLSLTALGQEKVSIMQILKEN